MSAVGLPPDAAAGPTTQTAAPVANGLMARRFRGFLPVVVDVETGGFHSTTDALLEIATTAGLNIRFNETLTRQRVLVLTRSDSK